MLLKGGTAPVTEISGKPRPYKSILNEVCAGAWPCKGRISQQIKLHVDWYDRVILKPIRADEALTQQR